MSNQSEKSANRAFSLSLVPALLLAVFAGGCDGSSGGGGGVTNPPPDQLTVPGAPALSGSQNLGTVNLSWDASGDIDFYQLYRDTSEDAPNPTLYADSLKQSSFADSIDQRTTFYYQVKACNSAGCSDFSNTLALLRSSPPATPNSLAADASGDTIILSWNQPDDPYALSSYYQVFRNTRDSTADAQEVSQPLTSSGMSYSDSSAALVATTRYYYWLKACNIEGCSGFSSSVSAVADSASLLLSFSSVDNSVDSVIGMREFLLTVTVYGVADPTTFGFIVGESNSAPDWNRVADHPATLVRDFSSDTRTRTIYFSATEEYSADSGKHRVDLSLATDNDEVAYTRSNAPGIMIPGQTYHVHAYSGQEHIASREVTTANYPTAALPVQYGGTNGRIFNSNGQNYISPFAWGMHMWKPRDVTNDLYQTTRFDRVELDPDELNLFPVRMLFPVNQQESQSICASRPTQIYDEMAGSGLTTTTRVWFGFTDSSSNDSYQGYRFVKSAHIDLSTDKAGELIDSMHYYDRDTLSNFAATGINLRLRFTCVVIGQPNPFRFLNYGDLRTLSE